MDILTTFYSVFMDCLEFFADTFYHIILFFVCVQVIVFFVRLLKFFGGS